MWIAADRISSGFRSGCKEILMDHLTDIRRIRVRLALLQDDRRLTCMPAATAIIDGQIEAWESLLRGYEEVDQRHFSRSLLK